MTDPRELQSGDYVRIDHEELTAEYKVSDVAVEDIGITETFAVTLVGGDGEWAIVGTTADSTATVQRVGPKDEEHVVNWNDIEIQ